MTTIESGSNDEFVRMKELVENLRASLPPLKEHQYQLIGLYVLSALYLGRGQDDYHRPIDDFYNLTRSDIPAKPGFLAGLRVIK